MSTHSICFYKEVDTNKDYECVLIGVCAIIRTNTVLSRYPLLSRPMWRVLDSFTVGHRALINGLNGINPCPAEPVDILPLQTV